MRTLIITPNTHYKKTKTMKNLILTTAILLTSLTLYSQLEVKEVGNAFESIHQEGSSLWLDIHVETRMIVLMYKNLEYKYATDIKSIKFNDLIEVGEFLDVCEKVASVEKDKSYYIQDNILITNFMKKYAIVYVSSSNHFLLSVKWIDKIRESIVKYESAN